MGLKYNKDSLDNRRLLVAQRAGVMEISIKIVNLDAPRPDGGTYGSNLLKKVNSRSPNDQMSKMIVILNKEIKMMDYNNV